MIQLPQNWNNEGQYIITESSFLGECSWFCRWYLNERIYVQHQGLCSADDELVHTGNGMRPTTDKKHSTYIKQV